MKSFVYIFAALTTLASAQQSQIDIQANKIINDITYGIKKVTECNVDQKNTALGQIIYKDLIVFNEASENKFELATSDKKINNEQKKQLIEFAKDTNKCKELSNQLFVNYPKILLVRMNFSNK